MNLNVSVQNCATASNFLNHRAALETEVNIFRNGFERNERFKELDGLIKRNQRVVEALDDFERLDTTCFGKVTGQLNQLNTNLADIDHFRFSDAELRDMNFRDINQIKIKALADAKFFKT